MKGPNLLLLHLLLGTISIQASKLNVPRVLLPFTSSPPPFTLEAESGCYKWTSNRPDIAKVDGGSRGDCSNSAKLLAVGTSGSRGSAMVTAEDTTTGLMLRADVIVDSIHELKIVTKTHELYLEETPEKFEVRAYDQQGNEFSTLRGIKFRWSIVSGGAAKTDILRFMSWRASPYNTEPILEQLEAGGDQGNKVLLEGVKTGSARVSVRLEEGQYTSVPPATEPLLVVANLFLIPPSAYLLPCATLAYSAQQFRGNRLLPVSLPSPHHRLELPAEVGIMDGTTATLTASKEPAEGQLQLVDQNVGPGEEVKTPSAEVHVVLPHRLELSLLPHKSWSVTVGMEVAVLVEVFDIAGNKIHASEDLVINLNTDLTHLTVKSSLTNGTLTTLTPTMPAATTLTATLVGTKACSLGTPLTASAVLEIHPALSLEPPLTILPWDPVSATVYSVKHLLTGGEAPFSWASSLPSLAATSQLGVSEVQGKIIGSSIVSAAMTRAPHCRVEAEVRVAPAAILDLLESAQEFLVSEPLALPLLLTPSKPLPKFSSCFLLPLETSHSASSFSSSLGPASSDSHCATIFVTSLMPSHSTLGVSWTFPTTEGKVVLSANRTVASYAPLVPHSPISGETVVAEGSSRELAWQGGPIPWPLLPSSHYREIEIADSNMVTLEPLPHSSLHRYKLTCLGKGETKVTLRVGNKPSATLPLPVSTSSTITVNCAIPHSIELVPQVPRPNLPGLPPCPLEATQGRQAAHSYLPLTIEVTIMDASNRVIDSVENVPVSWDLSSSVIGTLEKQEGLFVGADARDGVLQPGGAHQVLATMGKTGEIDITATIAREGGMLGKSSHSDSCQLLLVEDASLSPSTLSLFELEEGKAAVKSGSGYFALQSPVTGEMSASYLPANRSVVVTPSGPGLASLVLSDLCLTSRTEAKLDVTVSGLASIELTVADKVEVGSTLTATLTLLDASGFVLPASALQHIHLSLDPSASLLSVGEGSGLTFPVFGASLGFTSLTASASYSGTTISSNPAPVTIYPPLAVSPRNISLIIGATFQFLATGGPLDCTVVWKIGDLDIASSNQEGIVTASTLGATRLTAKAVSRDGQVFSEDTVEVHVRPLTDLRIMAPTHTLLQGNILPLYLYGQDDDMTVYSYASASPLLNVDWSVSGAGSIRDIESPLAGTGHSLISDNAGVVIFKGNSLGKTTVSVTVSISQPIGAAGQHQLERDRSLTTAVTITVTSPLELLGEDERVVASSILLPQSSSHQLHTNRAATWTSSSTLISVTKSGLITTGASLGSAILKGLSTEGGREEELAVKVEVRKVAYLALRGQSRGWEGASLESLPRGVVSGLTVTRHDIWGRQFVETSKPGTGHRPSRFDLVRVARGGEGLEGKAIARGWTVVRVKEGVKECWLVARVGEGISGPSSLNSGDVTSFVSPFTSGSWTSEPKGIVEVDSKTGEVVALGPGQARLQYDLGSGGVLSRLVSVQGEESAALRSSQPILASATSVVPLLLGGSHSSNLVSSTEVKPDLDPKSVFACEAEWASGEGGLSSVWSVNPSWVEGGWACVFTPRGGEAPFEPRKVRLSVEGSAMEVQYLPSITLVQERIEVGLEGGEVKLVAHPSLLPDVQVVGSEGVDVGVLGLTEGQLVLPVHLTLPHYLHNPTITFSHPPSGQVVTATLLPLLSSCPANHSGIISAILGSLLVYWQSVLVTLLAVTLAMYLTRKSLKQGTSPPAAAPPAPSTPAPSKQPEEVGGTYLWTQDKSPIYGSPIFRRSPPAGARNMTQYSYN